MSICPRFIYFVPDPPHLLKTCRNNLLNKNKSLWNNGDIFMEPIKQLIRDDLALGELRIYPKLTESHANPNPWQKMNVRLAAQTLSHTVGMVMREKGYVALGEFVLTIDKWFDYVNAGFQGRNFKDDRRPFKSIDDPRLAWLSKDFIGYLDEWEVHAKARPLVGDVDREKMILTKATRTWLRIATMSMVEIVKCAMQSGAEYVLPRRINQDPLESYFGHQRERGARTNNPSVTQFTSNAKNIAVLKSCVSDFCGANVEIVP